MDKGKLTKVDFGGKDCEIFLFEGPLSPAMMPGYVKMEVSEAHRGEISLFYQQIPALLAAEALNDAYIIRWHNGLPHKLAPYKNFPALSPVTRNSKGQIGQWVELYPASTQAALLSGFTAMSIVTGQYFLAEINQKMNMMQQGIDKILEFLYGDKKAELLSEINFAKYAYQNYSSIVGHEEQCIATLIGLQEGRKTAIKDIDFYLADLAATVRADGDGDIEGTANKAFRIRECLELSNQLFMMTNVLESFYSQNFDPGYLKYVEDTVADYISKCDMNMLGSFHALRANIDVYKQPKIGKKVPKVALLERVDTIIELLQNPSRIAAVKKDLNQALHSSERPSEYCITSDGNVYLKQA